MQIRAPKSIGFGAKRAEKSPYKRTIPYDASLGARCRVFESPHSDQLGGFDRKRAAGGDSAAFSFMGGYNEQDS